MGMDRVCVAAHEAAFFHRFPGEGRGPVTEQKLICAAARYIGHPNWTPAFAGETK